MHVCVCVCVYVGVSVDLRERTSMREVLGWEMLPFFLSFSLFYFNVPLVWFGSACTFWSARLSFLYHCLPVTVNFVLFLLSLMSNVLVVTSILVWIKSFDHKKKKRSSRRRNHLIKHKLRETLFLLVPIFVTSLLHHCETKETVDVWADVKIQSSQEEKQRFRGKMMNQNCDWILGSYSVIHV